MSTIEAIEPQLPVTETPDEKIARLEAALAKAQQGNLTRPIELAEGKVTVESLTADLRAYNEEMALQNEKNRRWREEYEAKHPVAHVKEDGGLEWKPLNSSQRPLYGEAEDAERLVGRQRWETFTREQKAQTRTITANDLSRFNPLDYFGKDCGRKASELMAANPGLYSALKAKAVKDGII